MRFVHSFRFVCLTRNLCVTVAFCVCSACVCVLFCLTEAEIGHEFEIINSFLFAPLSEERVVCGDRREWGRERTSGCSNTRRLLRRKHHRNPPVPNTIWFVRCLSYGIMAFAIREVTHAFLVILRHLKYIDPIRAYTHTHLPIASNVNENTNRWNEWINNWRETRWVLTPYCRQTKIGTTALIRLFSFLYRPDEPRHSKRDPKKRLLLSLAN